LPQGVAFSPCTQLDHLIVNHDITNPLIRPDSVFNTGSETGESSYFWRLFVFFNVQVIGFVCPNVVQDLMVVSPASESPSDWPMCWSCGDVTVDGIGCRICRRQHHAFCARKGRKLICTQVIFFFDAVGGVVVFLKVFPLFAVLAPISLLVLHGVALVSPLRL